MKKQLVVIGNGMAAMRALETLFSQCPEHDYQITVFGKEPHENYNRIMLSPVLAGETAFDEIILNSRHWYQTHKITLHGADPVISIHRQDQYVTSLSGLKQSYDVLIIATGSVPSSLGLAHENIQGVTGFRTLADVEKMQQSARHHQQAVVVGGGFLGLEAAAGLVQQGMAVTLLHRSPWLLNRQLDPSAAALLQQQLEARGIQFRLQQQIQQINPDQETQNSKPRIKGVTLDNGDDLPCDLLVIAAGITPEISLARDSGLNCERGIVVNETLQTSDPAIFALGECCQYQSQCYGLVAPAWEQAEILGRYLAGQHTARYEGSRTATRLKISGIDLFSAGEINPAPDEGSDILLMQAPEQGIYRKLVLTGNRLTGVLFYGDVSDSNWYFQLLKEQQDLSTVRHTLMFGQALNPSISDHTEHSRALRATPNQNLSESGLSGTEQAA